MVAEEPTPPAKSRSPDGNQEGYLESPSSEATRQGPGSPSGQTSTTPAATELVLAQVLKWSGVALLVIAGLLAVYLGADLLGELAARDASP